MSSEDSDSALGAAARQQQAAREGEAPRGYRRGGPGRFRRWRRWGRRGRPRDAGNGEGEAAGDAAIPPEEAVPALDAAEVFRLENEALAERAREAGVSVGANPKAQDLRRGLFEAHARKLGFRWAEGTLEMLKDGAGFLRSDERDYHPSVDDPFVPPALIRRFGLRMGDFVGGLVRLPGARAARLAHPDLVWGRPAEEIAARTPYDKLTPFYPQKRLILERGREPSSMRAVDLIAPLGRGQRCLIVAPPRAGKTILLQEIARSIEANDPDVELLVLLLDERPEEVHNMKQGVRGEVIASTFDETLERHVRIADLVIERAHRMLECGRHVVLLLDSLTRFARACNNLSSPRGRLMSGGVEAGALAKPRKFFSSARNIEGGGSLTIVATVLVETGSRMDELIFEEFKGTGNAEIHLSRDLQERRIYPAIHMEKSATRREEMLYHPEEYERVKLYRRRLLEHPPLEAMEILLSELRATDSNAELLMRLKTG
ncbi:MAG: transcription termination factor Rho [Verrucomicrobiae bacterium]|nr:transcription termination factor Rho [Verrucomicrobiae bacterium]